MHLFSWLFGSDTTSDRLVMQIANLTNGPGTYDVDVVGESYYQKTLERICGGRPCDSARLKVKAFLVPEDDNPHDPKAVRICIGEETVGYLDRETARSFRKAMTKSGLAGVA